MCPNSHSGSAVGLEDEPRSSDTNPCPSHAILLAFEFCSICKGPWDAPESHGKSPWQREITERRMGRPQTSSLNFLIVTWGPQVSGNTLVLLLSKVPVSLTVSACLGWDRQCWQRGSWQRGPRKCHVGYQPSLRLEPFYHIASLCEITLSYVLIHFSLAFFFSFIELWSTNKCCKYLGCKKIK